MKFIRLSLVLCCVLSCLFGCSSKRNPDGRLDVNGTITFNGGPFEGANSCIIIFEPLDIPSSDSSSTTFDPVTGKYLCTMQDGLKPGKYRVKISVQAMYDRKTNQPVPQDFGAREEDKGYSVSMLPPDFNEKSNIEFEAVKGKKNVFDYNIETSYVPVP